MASEEESTDDINKRRRNYIEDEMFGAKTPPKAHKNKDGMQINRHGIGDER